eukprot:4929375-Prymnesium_polylepis.2
MTEASALTSVGSPRAVPVPCASTHATSCGWAAAIPNARESSNPCAEPLGAVRLADRPSCRTELPLRTATSQVPLASCSMQEPRPSERAYPFARVSNVLQRPSMDSIDRRHEHKIDASGQRSVVAHVQPQQRAVNGNESRRARRVHALARPQQAQGERDATGGDGDGATCGSKNALRLRREHREVDVHDTQIDALLAAHHGLAAQPSGHKRRVPRLEEQPLLRIHHRRLGGRDAEAARVKAVREAQEAAVPDTVVLGCAEVLNSLRGVPSLCGDRAHTIAARAHERP